MGRHIGKVAAERNGIKGTVLKERVKGTVLKERWSAPSESITPTDKKALDNLRPLE